MQDTPAQEYPAINIFSGEKGLGGALTNPTELARSKGCIERAYWVTFAGRRYPDVEAAYHAHKQEGDEAANDQLMVELIVAKFEQHPLLADAVRKRGGAAWLARCSHWTGAKTERAQSWEGDGLESRFIRNLVAAWERLEAGIREEQGQSLLF